MAKLQNDKDVQLKMEVLLATLNPMLAMFLCMLVGFVLNKCDLVSKNSGEVLSKLENYIFVPALVFATFSEYCNVESLVENRKMLLYAVISLAVAYAISIPLSMAFQKKGTYRNMIYQYALTFGNFSFMGNAIVPAIMGRGDHLFKYMLFTLPLLTAVYTWGIFILTPKENRKGSVFKSLLSPIFFALVLGIIVGVLDLKKYIPSYVQSTISYFKSCMAPLAMFLTGFVVGGYNFKSLLRHKKVYIATLLRLFVIPAVILSLLKLLGAEDYTILLALIAYATPLGLNTVVFPEAFGGDSKPGASMAMISHILCVISIPIMYSLANWILAIV